MTQPSPGEDKKYKVEESRGDNGHRCYAVWRDGQKCVDIAKNDHGEYVARTTWVARTLDED